MKNKINVRVLRTPKHFVLTEKNCTGRTRTHKMKLTLWQCNIWNPCVSQSCLHRGKRKQQRPRPHVCQQQLCFSSALLSPGRHLDLVFLIIWNNVFQILNVALDSPTSIDKVALHPKRHGSRFWHYFIVYSNAWFLLSHMLFSFYHRKCSQASYSHSKSAHPAVKLAINRVEKITAKQTKRSIFCFFLLLGALPDHHTSLSSNLHTHTHTHSCSLSRLNHLIWSFIWMRL